MDKAESLKKNILLVLKSFVVTTNEFKNKSVYNENLISKFKEEKDKDKLNKAIKYLKEDKTLKHKEITLSNNKKLTIVVS